MKIKRYFLNWLAPAEALDFRPKPVRRFFRSGVGSHLSLLPIASPAFPLSSSPCLPSLPPTLLHSTSLLLTLFNFSYVLLTRTLLFHPLPNSSFLLHLFHHWAMRGVSCTQPHPMSNKYIIHRTTTQMETLIHTQMELLITINTHSKPNPIAQRHRRQRRILSSSWVSPPCQSRITSSKSVTLRAVSVSHGYPFFFMSS